VELFEINVAQSVKYMITIAW